MKLIGEARIRDLLPAGSPGRLEASGVVVVGGRYLVIFDNLVNEKQQRKEQKRPEIPPSKRLVPKRVRPRIRPCSL